MQLKPDMVETPFNTTQTEIVTENLNTSSTHDLDVLSEEEFLLLEQGPDQHCSSKRVCHSQLSMPCNIWGESRCVHNQIHRLQNTEKKYSENALLSTQDQIPLYSKPLHIFSFK